MTVYHVKVLDPTNDIARDYIADRLAEFNAPFVGEDEPIKVVLGVDSDEREQVAGLSAVIYYHVMSIELLWVHEDVRGQGVGKRLLEQAERIARHSGCSMIHLDTFDFQAPTFYEKLGFERWGILGPYPNGHQRYFYRKMIVKKPTSSAWGYKKEKEE
jgi:GNAT superfamily N-acetyltransferase